MGYIPAPPRGIIKVQDAEPAPQADVVWFCRTDGNLRRYDDLTGRWLPVGEGNLTFPPGTGDHAVGLGEIGGKLEDSVVIGSGAIAYRIL